ncbi:hypothetical protein ACFQ0M_35190 [Kitasatospora aburaviensis]
MTASLAVAGPAPQARRSGAPAAPAAGLLAAVRADADRISSTVNLAAFENVLSRTAERMLHSPWRTAT